MITNRTRWNPVTGLVAVVGSIPLAWVFGLEQFVVPAVAIGWAILLYVKQPCPLHPEMKLLIAFVLVSLASVSALSGGREWLLWSRGLLTLVAGVLAMWLASNIVIGAEVTMRLVRGAILALLCLACLAAAVAVEVLPLSFGVPIPQMFPGWARSSFVEQLLLTRHLAGEVSDFGGPQSSLLLGLPRFSGFFLYSGDLGTAVIVLQIAVLLGWPRLTLRWRRLAVTAFAGSLFVLLVSGSRSAVVLSLGALAAVVVVRLGYRVRSRVGVQMLGAVALAALVVAGVPLPGGSIIQRLFVDVRPGSLSSRTEVYERTLDRTMDRPLFGWGIQERAIDPDVADVSRLRAGTHSEPLNVLYRFGFVGGALYFAAIGALWVALIRRLRQIWITDRARFDLLLVAAIGGVVVAGHALVHTLQSDANVYLLIMTLAGATRALIDAPVDLPLASTSTEERRGVDAA